MKPLCLILVLCCGSLWGQVSIMPAIAYTPYNVQFGSFSASNFSYGGDGNATLNPSINLEWALKRKPILDSTSRKFRLAQSTFKSVLVAFHYNNHELSVSGFTQSGDPIFSTMKARYLQIPIFFQFNMKPFTLNEDFSIGMGIGVVNSILLKNTLREEATLLTRDTNGAIIGEELISDSDNVTRFNNRYSWMVGLEFTIRFKRLYLAERAWFTLTDQYMEGLIDEWNVPVSHSVYLGSYETWPKVIIGGGAFVLGWKIN